MAILKSIAFFSENLVKHEAFKKEERADRITNCEQFVASDLIHKSGHPSRIQEITGF